MFSHRGGPRAVQTAETPTEAELCYRKPVVQSDPLVAGLHLTTACKARKREAMDMHIIIIIIIKDGTPECLVDRL